MKNLRTGTAKFDAIRAKDASGLYIQDDGGNGLFIKDGGNVGIGTTIPSAKLHIENTTGSSLILQSLGSYADGHQPVIILAGKNPSEVNKNLARIRAASEGTELGALAFDVRMGAGTPHEEAMRIDSDGNVGIGTTSPSAKLTLPVSESISFDDSSGNSKCQINSGAAGTLQVQGDFDLRFKTTVEAMRIDANGNVGIGTTSPQHKLDISTNDTTGLRLINPDSAEVNQSNDPPAILFQANGWELRDDGDGSRAYSARIRVSSNYSGESGRGNTHPVMNFDLETNENNPDDNLSTKMMINADGNVGIGTTDPTAKFDVHGVAYFRTPDGGAFISSWSTGQSTQDKQPAVILRTNETNDADRVKLNSEGHSWFNGGNVGIGTTDPSAKLEIAQSDGFANDGIILNYLPSTYPNKYKSHIYHGGDGSLILESWAGAATLAGDILLAPNGGSVGIGTTNPGSYKLNVNGTARVVHSVNGSQEVTSDDRVKHNEQPIVGALETLGKITPKKYIKTTEMYDANHDFELDADGNPIDANGEPVEHRIEAGVIAQQVLTVDELAFAVSPEDVDEDGVVTSPYGLDYNSLFTYAIAAIQEQQEIIETQNSRIDELISRIETLEQ
jgi:hypothetical protein